MTTTKEKSSIKKCVLIAIIFFVIAILCILLSEYFEFENNQICNEMLSFTIEDTLLGKNDELLSKADLYYDLAIIAKFIGYGSFGITIILSVFVAYQKFKKSNDKTENEE